jgi:septal ring factor EnvC (AmiA/AmiB activator)
MVRGAAALLLIAGTAAVAASAPRSAETSPVELQLRQARSEAAAASARQQRLEQAASQARDEVARLHASQLAAVEAISAAEAEITASDVAVHLAEAQLELQRRRLASAEAPVSSLLGGLVLSARRPPLLLLANSRSADELVKLRILIGATAPVIRAKTAALRNELRQGAKLEQAAIAARSDLRKRRSQLDQRRNAFAQLEKRALAMAKERGSQALGAGDVAITREEQVADIQANAASKREAQKIAQELAELGPVPLRGPGAPQRPPILYRLPAEAAVLDGLGTVSANGVRSRGILLDTRRGAALVAPAGGTVLFAGPFRDYDGVIIIDHGGGWKSVLVNAGSRLSKGATIEAGEALGIALGPVEIQLQHDGRTVSPALIAGSSAVLSNRSKGG